MNVDPSNRARFEAWYNSQPEGKLSPWDVWRAGAAAVVAAVPAPDQVKDGPDLVFPPGTAGPVPAPEPTLVQRLDDAFRAGKAYSDEEWRHRVRGLTAERDHYQRMFESLLKQMANLASLTVRPVIIESTTAVDSRQEFVQKWRECIALNPRVKIIHSALNMWYLGLVGQFVTIERVDSDGLWAREPAGYINVIRFDDVTWNEARL